MSLRQQAAARRRIRELEQQLQNAQRVAERRTLTGWGNIGQRMRDEIATAITLGFVVEASTSDESVTLTAVKRVYV